MIKRILHITRYLLVAVLPLLASCSEDVFEPAAGDGSSAAVTFRASIDTGIQSRAISDGTGADRLLVAVYEGETPAETYRKDCVLDTALTSGIELRLLSGHSYKVLFWAYDGDNTAYKVSDQGVITAEYKDYLAGGFVKMEQLDAFYAVSEISVSGDKSESVTLTRPFAQLNIADNLTRPERGTHRSEVTFESVATSFNALTGEVAGETRNLTFSFEDFPEETLTSGSDTYYIATNYLFVPASGKVSATCRLKQTAGGSVITERVIPDIALTANKRTNVFGSLVQQPEDMWDGIKLTEPGKDGQNRYVIDEASDLAWLVQHGSTLEQNRTFVFTKDLNMADKTLSPVVLPQGSTIEGGGHTIKNLSMNGGGLFGNATNLTVKELTVDKIAIKNADNHTGALVNTLKGNGAFSSVTVKNATVATTNGAAGGMVGYVVRKSEKDRNETLTLTFNGCRVESTSVSGTRSEGKFVGLLSGYELKESVSFAADCSVSDDVTVADFASPYTEGNEGAWLATNDYTKYNGWLGDEDYNRGTVNYGGVRFIPCWDGKKKVPPLEENGTKLIYSAFDLAALQGGSHSAVTFKEKVDLGGDGADKNLFSPISNIAKLDGENHSLYNLNIYKDSWVVGFVTGTGGETEHKNLHFISPSVRAKMASDANNIYVATLCPYVEHKYSVENVTITDGYVLGLGKLGGLIGFVTSWATGPLSVKKCTLSKTTIENIKSSAEDSFMGVKFNPQGEVGGLIGFIQNIAATISDCTVKNCTMNCYGQDNKWLIITIPGRHVNDFIGDIRSDAGNRIDLNNNSVDNNSFTNRKKDTHSKQCTIVGKCYKISGTKGTVYIDNTKVY